MKRIPLLILLAAGLLLLQQSFAQEAKPKPEQKPAAKLPEVTATLGQSGYSGGRISKQEFDALLKQGVKVSGDGKVTGFNFSYSEHILYEDSAGNPLLTTQYMMEHCDGNMLSAGISGSIFDRTKAGDTAYFDQIKVVLPSGAAAMGKAMKFVITPTAGR